MNHGPKSRAGGFVSSGTKKKKLSASYLYSSAESYMCLGRSLTVRDEWLLAIIPKFEPRLFHHSPLEFQKLGACALPLDFDICVRAYQDNIKRAFMTP